MSSGNATDRVPAARAPRRQRGRDRVAGLLEAAAALFVEKGFEATTMTEIAARAGASIGALYLFFPAKTSVAAALATELADRLSTRLDDLRVAGWPAATIADALFDALTTFLTAHPVYSTLIELPGDDGWKLAVRARRRGQIATLFASARPALPAGQPERLAVIVPQLMRIAMAAGGEAMPDRAAVTREVRTMLRHHLAWPEDDAGPDPGT